MQKKSYSSNPLSNSGPAYIVSKQKKVVQQPKIITRCEICQKSKDEINSLFNLGETWSWNFWLSEDNKTEKNLCPPCCTWFYFDEAGNVRETLQFRQFLYAKGVNKTNVISFRLVFQRTKKNKCYIHVMKGEPPNQRTTLKNKSGDNNWIYPKLQTGIEMTNEKTALVMNATQYGLESIDYDRICEQIKLYNPGIKFQIPEKTFYDYYKVTTSKDLLPGGIHLSFLGFFGDE